MTEPRTARTRRSRWPVVVAGVVAVVAVAGLAWALVGRPGPDATEPTAAPTPEVTPTSEPTPEPTTPEPTPAEPQLVALTTAGDIVVLDPADGQVLYTLASGLPIDTGNHSGLALSPDGTHAFVNSSDPYEILEVTLAQGGTRVVSAGWHPALSADGTRLAFAGVDEANGSGTGLWLTDLRSGEARHVPDEQAMSDAPRVVTDPSWSPDGATVYVANGWPEGSFVLAVDPESTAQLGQARVVGPADESLSWGSPEPMPDGRLAVYVREAGYEPADESMQIALVDPATGAVATRIDTPGRWVHDLAAHPTDGSLAVVSEGGALAIWDGAALRDVGTGYEAVVWHVGLTW